MHIRTMLCTHPPLNSAVQLCCDARNQILSPYFRTSSSTNPNFDASKFTKALKQAPINFQIQGHASTAYRLAMPDPSTHQGIRDFIACVLHGMAIGAIEDREGTKLLSGARVALSTHRSSLAQDAENCQQTTA